MILKKIAASCLAVMMTVAFCTTAYADNGDYYTLSFEGEGYIFVNNEAAENNMQIKPEDDVRFVCKDAVAVATKMGYYKTDEPVKIDRDMNLGEVRPLTLGLDMVNGAQIRVGIANHTDGEEIDTEADSGLRFIATANYSDTVINEPGAEFGIKIQAEDSSEVVYVPAQKFQNDDKTVFSAAMTGLSASNFNRRFTACAYAKITGADGEVIEFTSGEVVRSIYQVAVGIMKNDRQDGGEVLESSVNDVVRSILNSYINQVGIRLTYTSSDKSVSIRNGGSGSYTGDLFFDVEYEDNGDGGVKVTIIPLGLDSSFGNEVKIADWWMKYVRVNNNNSRAKAFIRDAKIENNILTFTFKVVNYKFDQNDDVMIVTRIAENEIEGVKGGESVVYTLKENWEVVGLSYKREAIVPGCVVLTGMTEDGECGGLELLATIGNPLNANIFEMLEGVRMSADNSGQYRNVLSELYSKSGVTVRTKDASKSERVQYVFRNSSVMCYCVNIDENGNVDITKGKIGQYPSVFKSTSEYKNYLYLRYDTEISKVVQCVFYCVDKNLDFTGDGEYSDIFNLEVESVID